MDKKRVGLGGLVVTLVCLGAARAEDMPAPGAGAAGPANAGPSGELAPDAGPAHPSNWLDYPRCLGCCGPVGRNGPVEYEIYLRNGFDFPLGGNTFGARMKTGWDVSAGARTLFFNPERDAAWTADIGVRNVFNESRDRTTVIPGVGVVVNNLNRTYLDVAAGREWYLLGGADCDKPEANWRVGFDLGGRYGTEKLDVVSAKHLTDTNAGLFVAVHSDLEVPMGCCIFLAGLRSEYGYTWSDILQTQNNGDIQEISLLFNLGVRF